METKQVIVIRKDLRTKNGQKLPVGKEDAQVAHASMAFLTRRLQPGDRKEDENILSGRFTDEELAWINGSFRKVVLVANDEDELFQIYGEAMDADLEVHLITDSGYTCFEEPTHTCVAIGPHTPEKIDAITGNLRLR
jgi:PTH2 family peptidyl-tRNA hydrolase